MIHKNENSPKVANKTSNETSNETGSAIIWILIAVGLFAALGFAFNSSSRTSTSALTDAEAGAYAKQIIAYGNEVKSAVKRLQLRGCKDTEISFANDVYKAVNGTIFYPDGHNTNSPTNGRCDIYKQTGGGLNPALITLEAIAEWPGIGGGNSKPGIARNGRAEMPGVGQANQEELLFFVPYINKNVCLKINDILNVTNPSGDAPKSTNTIVQYHGVFTDNGSITMADDDGILSTKKSFCAAHPTGNAWEFFYTNVLIVR